MPPTYDPSSSATSASSACWSAGRGLGGVGLVGLGPVSSRCSLKSRRLGAAPEAGAPLWSPSRCSSPAWEYSGLSKATWVEPLPLVEEALVERGALPLGLEARRLVGDGVPDLCWPGLLRLGEACPDAAVGDAGGVGTGDAGGVASSRAVLTASTADAGAEDGAAGAGTLAGSPGVVRVLETASACAAWSSACSKLRSTASSWTGVFRRYQMAMSRSEAVSVRSAMALKASTGISTYCASMEWVTRRRRRCTATLARAEGNAS